MCSGVPYNCYVQGERVWSHHTISFKVTSLWVITKGIHEEFLKKGEMKVEFHLIVEISKRLHVHKNSTGHPLGSAQVAPWLLNLDLDLYPFCRERTITYANVIKINLSCVHWVGYLMTYLMHIIWCHLDIMWLMKCSHLWKTWIWLLRLLTWH